MKQHVLTELPRVHATIWSEQFMTANKQWNPIHRRPSLLQSKREQFVSTGKKTFAAHDCCKTADLEGSTINMKTWNVLLGMHTKRKKYLHGGVIPSDSSIKRVQVCVECFGQKNVGMRKGVTRAGGEFVEFDVDRILVYAMKAFGLSEIAKTRSI